MDDTRTPLRITDDIIVLTAARLEPIIARTLEPELNGLHWTQALVALDSAKGKERIITATDPQSHLRIITERLGTLGYPFDDQSRTVSSLGSQLRFMRNRVAHKDPLTEIDAWRTADAAARLLAFLGDEEGARELEMQRDSIFRLTPPTVTAPDPQGSAQEPEVAEPEAETRPEVVPDAEVLSAPDTPPSAPKVRIIEAQRLEYEPWPVQKVGEKEVLDSLRKGDNAAKVRAVIEDIVDFEGPIHVNRLIKLTGRAFDFGKVHKDRTKQLAHQVKKADVQIIGNFAWPREMDPQSWTGFRPNSSAMEREFDEIAPQEIRNASRFLRERHPEDSPESHERRVMQVFGRSQRSPRLSRHLNASLA